ncbi:hypothetical protein AB6A40_004471 [Gnathostoma spinigerum]|uniref:WD repeat-containing protein 37 n=1 Tax=Gnathostoma spinigerum TaxID=75299 RepID=A0ABD6EM25_9BILA
MKGHREIGCSVRITTDRLIKAKVPENERILSEFAVEAQNRKTRLYQLFEMIEKEFDAIYAENCSLRMRLNSLSDRTDEPVCVASEAILQGKENVSTSRIESSRKGMQMGQKLKTALRVPPGRLVQSLKGGGGDTSRRFKYVRSLLGHRDGVWHVTTSKSSQQILASASADQTCLLWSLETGICIGRYTGHSGSVNGVAFSPSSCDPSDLMLATASGDHSAHIWKAAVPVQSLHAVVSSEEEAGTQDRDTAVLNDEQAEGDELTTPNVRQPLRRLTGHNGVVISVDWTAGGDHVITASWDRTANIYDVERGEIITVLSGHDDELNHCSAHASQKLVVTASRDSTFRLWDFRESIHSVAVFQGHSDSVTSVIFAPGDRIVSGSDDRCVKVWDLRNMRCAMVTVRLDSAANRLAISSNNLIAIPHDNRHVRVYDLKGNRLARLPRTNGRSHRRMVCCATWADDHPTNDLITCGFDKQIIAWKMTAGKE